MSWWVPGALLPSTSKYGDMNILYCTPSHSLSLFYDAHSDFHVCYLGLCARSIIRRSLRLVQWILRHWHLNRTTLQIIVITLANKMSSMWFLTDQTNETIVIFSIVIQSCLTLPTPTCSHFQTRHYPPCTLTNIGKQSTVKEALWGRWVLIADLGTHQIRPIPTTCISSHLAKLNAN